MSYTDPTKIRQLLDPAGNAGSGSAASLEDPILQGAADRASSEVNSRLGGRYRVPFPAPYPDLVVRIATDLAAYDATLSFYGSTDITDTDPVVRRYKESMQLLIDISAGRADLFLGESDVDPPQELGGRASVRNPYTGSLFGPEDFGLRTQGGLTGWWPSR